VFIEKNRRRKKIIKVLFVEDRKLVSGDLLKRINEIGKLNKEGRSYFDSDDSEGDENYLMGMMA